jgi:hypothetical protein
MYLDFNLVPASREKKLCLLHEITIVAIQVYAILQRHLKILGYKTRRYSTCRISTFSGSISSGIQEVGKSGHFPVCDKNSVKDTARPTGFALRPRFESGLLSSGDPYWTVIMRNDNWQGRDKVFASYFKILHEILSEEMRNCENSSSWTPLDENDTNHTLQYCVPEVGFG